MSNISVYTVTADCQIQSEVPLLFAVNFKCEFITYTRDTAETVQNTQSESDNYEGYFCGDLPSWNQEKSSSSSEGEGELATPKLRESKGTRVWVESAGSKVYVEATSLASDEGSRSEACSNNKERKRNEPRSEHQRKESLIRWLS